MSGPSVLQTVKTAADDGFSVWGGLQGVLVLLSSRLHCRKPKPRTRHPDLTSNLNPETFAIELFANEVVAQHVFLI